MQLFIDILLIVSLAIGVFLGVRFLQGWRAHVRLEIAKFEFERLRRMIS